MLMATAYWLARRYNLPREDAFSWQRVRRSAREALWAFLLPIIILGGIFGGVVTATEGAALAVVAALAVGLLIYRELNLGHLRQAIIEGAIQTAVVMFSPSIPSDSCRTTNWMVPSALEKICSIWNV